MATENPLWGEERIANELRLKLGLHVSPRTVRKYMPKRPSGRPRGDQRWSTFLRNHAQGIVACDFFVSVTVTFRLFYVLVLIEHGSRRLLHFNTTQHPTAAWTLQQLREALGYGDFRYLIHDRDRIFAKSLDASIKNLGLTVLKSPPHSPKANAICERVIGTIRRECLDWLIPLSESHLRSMLKVWVTHYNEARPHMALGPGVPDPPAGAVPRVDEKSRHHLGARAFVCARSVLGGLHHEYSVARAPA
jgi:putative transposase